MGMNTRRGELTTDYPWFCDQLAPSDNSTLVVGSDQRNRRSLLDRVRKMVVV
jgi:hypothetical protein